MARGIEELTEMQVTGPVQGGDMVAKPNEMPTGAAALLNKMSRQNTPGIFKLPMPDKQMPDFMKVAAEGVEQQTARGDTINQMAGELLRQGINIQGMGMDEIIQIYEQTFGSPGDVDEFGVSQVDPSDWRSILKMIEAGMSQDEIEAQIAATKFPGNFTQEKQNIVELPRNLKTAPDNPETELAYITDDEKAILALMNPGTPHEGPKGVPTYDEGDYSDQWVSPSRRSSSGGRPGGAAETEQAAADYAAVADKDKDLYMAQAMQELPGFTPTKGGAYDQALQQAAAEEIVSVTDTGEIGAGGGGDTTTFNEQINEIWESDDPTVIKGLKDAGISSKTMLGDMWNATGGKIFDLFKGDKKKMRMETIKLKKNLILKNLLKRLVQELLVFFQLL